MIINVPNGEEIQKEVKQLSDQLTTPTGKIIYMDEKDGKVGYNTSADRGADTFHPFSASIPFSVKAYYSTGYARSDIAYSDIKSYSKIKIKDIIVSGGTYGYNSVVIYVDGVKVDEVFASKTEYEVTLSNVSNVTITMNQYNGTGIASVDGISFE